MTTEVGDRGGAATDNFSQYGGGTTFSGGVEENNIQKIVQSGQAGFYLIGKECHIVDLVDDGIGLGCCTDAWLDSIPIACCTCCAKGKVNVPTPQ